MPTTIARTPQINSNNLTNKCYPALNGNLQQGNAEIDITDGPHIARPNIPIFGNRTGNQHQMNSVCKNRYE